MLYITDNYSSCTSRVRGKNLFTSFWLASKKETQTMHPNNLLPTLPNIFFPATINWKSVFKQKLENLTQIFFWPCSKSHLKGIGRTIFLRCICFSNFSKNDLQILCFFMEIRGSMTFKTRLSMKKEAKSWISIRTWISMSSEQRLDM